MAQPVRKRAKTSKPRKSPTRRPRRTREEGKRLLLDAAETLLLNHHPEKIGIRDIATKAKVHHRFVAEWFGGKVGLFRAVHDAHTQTITELISTSTNFGDRGGAGLESVRHQIVLVNWLVTNGSKFKSLEDAFPSLGPAREFLLKNFNLQSDDADKTVQIIGAIAVADALLQPHLKMGYTPLELILHHIQSFNSQKK